MAFRATQWKFITLLALVASLALASPAAAKGGDDDWGKGRGHGHGNKHRHKDDHDWDGPRRSPSVIIVQPPSQQDHGWRKGRRAWVVGQTLPGSIVYVPVAPSVLVSLPPSPPGHHYVQVADDILLLALGSRMVVGALDNFSRY